MRIIYIVHNKIPKVKRIYELCISFIIKYLKWSAYIVFIYLQVEKVELDDIHYFSPEPKVDHYFEEHFDDASVLGPKWIKSQVEIWFPLRKKIM